MIAGDPNLYDYWPYRDRPKIVWPGGKKLAFWVAPNIEYYEFNPPRNPKRPGWPRPSPDVVGYSQRDYGNRVGHWRLMELMDKYGVRGSISLNVAMCDHCPEIIEACNERDWEFFSHGSKVCPSNSKGCRSEARPCEYALSESPETGVGRDGPSSMPPQPEKPPRSRALLRPVTPARQAHAPTAPRASGVKSSTAGTPPSRPGRKAHNCSLSGGTAGVSSEGPERSGGRA